jgi:hypothetical protein
MRGAPSIYKSLLGSLEPEPELVHPETATINKRIAIIPTEKSFFNVLSPPF